MTKQTIINIIFMLPVLTAFSQSERRLDGVVLNESNHGIPFATVHIIGSSMGTITNEEGRFQLNIPSDYSYQMLGISCMGFESSQLAIQGVQQLLEIQLKSSVIELEEVTVRPISAKDYVHKAIRKFAVNYGSEFSSNVYFRQLTNDNERMLQYAEGYMQAHVEDFLDDTSKIDQRLLLYQVEDKQNEIVFGSSRRQRKMEKARRKAKKQGKILDEDSLMEKTSKVNLSLVTPDLLMDMDPVRQIESFVDTAKFKVFNYEFNNDLNYLGKKVTVVDFHSKKKVKLNNVGLKGHVNGILYFDQESDAILGIDYDLDMVIPAAAKPIMFLVGIGASNLYMKNKVRYLQVEDRWFPQGIQLEMGLDISRKYLFKKNERSAIDVELTMSISDIEWERPFLIEEEFVFSRKKDFEDQVYPFPDSSWEMVNRIPLENIK